MAARRQRRYGTDVFREITPPESTNAFQASYWDLWFVVVLEGQFAGDWQQMASHFRETASPLTGYRSERMLTHQLHLQERMSEAGLSVVGLLGDVGLLKSEKARAKKKVLENEPNESEMSYWMKHTPRIEREARAMRAYWVYFPVMPDQYEKRVQRLFKKSLYRKGQTFALEEKLEKFVDKSMKKASLEQSVALYRALMTVVLERMEQIDDSYGSIGGFYGEILNKYIALPRERLDMPPEYFWQDLLEFVMWEDYGLTDEHKPALFKSLSASEVPLVEAILREQADELFALKITYQGENALTMLGMVCTLHQEFDKFVALAKEMGSRAWQRITTMSEMAEKNQRPELALAVYEAALGEGFHESSLREKYNKLKKRIESS